MGGLRALCCSNADKNDPDSHSPPNRPVQRIPERIPEKETPNDQNGVSGGSQGVSSSTEVSQEKPATKPKEKPEESPVEMLEGKPKEKANPRNLWKEAHDKLDASSQELLPATGVRPTDAIQGVIDITTEKYEEWEKGGLRIHRREKGDINIRDVSERIFGGAMKAQDIISTAVSFDPTGHASSAWTVISFGMSIIQNRLDRRDAIFESAAFLAENLAWFTIVDANYRDQGVDTDKNVDDALLRAYSAILAFTAEVNKSQNENEATRTWKSIFPLTGQALTTLKSAVGEQKAAANQWVQLSANLGDRKQARNHLAKTDAALKATERVEAKVKDAEEERQLEWLSNFSYSDHQNFLQSKHTADTGAWLFDSQEYVNWIVTPGDLLWLYGISGCGKSVLCSSVIDDIKEGCRLDPNSYIAYWYFRFDDDKTKSVYTMARSLIKQLSRSPLPSSVVSLWKEHHLQRDEPKPQTILDVLDAVISSVPDEGRVYLVFDALDECPGVTNQERMTLFFLLMGLLERHKDKVHILATSRPEEDIREELSQFPKIDLEDRLGEDVKIFVHAELQRRPRLSRYKEDVKKKVVDALLSSKERRFRWAELQIAELETKHSSNDLLKALKSVPQTLEATYRNVLDKIPPSDLSLVRNILMIICLSPIPFDTQTVADMVDIEFPSDIVPMCTSSLIIENKGKVQVAHFSVQEYLVVKKKTGEHHEAQFTMLDAHTYLAEKTVDCLLSQTQTLKEKEAMAQPLLVYSAKYWHVHMRFLSGTDLLYPELQGKIDRLFSESTVYFNWVRVADSDDRHTDSQWTKEPQDCEPPIHRASRMGFIKTVETLFIQGSDPLASYTQDLSQGRSLSSLNAAAQSGQLEVLQFLLSKRLQLPYNVSISLVEEIDHRQAGKGALADILRTLWDQGLLGGKSESPENNGIIKSYIIDLAMRNRTSSVQIMDVFLSWRPEVSVPVTEDMLWKAFNNRERTEDMPKLLLEKGGVHIPSDFFERRGMPYHAEGIVFLAAEHPNELPVTDKVIWCLAESCNTKTMDSLLRSRKHDISVTQEVLYFAARNQTDADMMRFLWAHREPDAKITEWMFPGAASNALFQQEVMSFLMEHLGSTVELSEEIIHRSIRNAKNGVAALKSFLSRSAGVSFVSQELLHIICEEKSDAVPMLKMLKNNGHLDMPITEDFLYHAACNNSAAPSVFSYLIELHGGQPPITERVLLAVVRNLKSGAQILKTILPDISDTILTDAIFKEACCNTDALVMLLDRGCKDPPVQSMLDQIEYSPGEGNVLQVLLERDLFAVDEAAVEKFATNFSCLEILLAWKPDVPITHKALHRATCGAAQMRAIMASKGNNLDIPEDILVAAAAHGEGKEVLEAIQNRKGPGCMTEGVLRNALTDANDEALEWLLQQQTEPIVTKIWEETWPDTDITAEVRFRVFAAYLEKTGVKITDTMLQDYPYNAAEEENYDFDDIVNALLTVDFLPDLPNTERTAEIVLERCKGSTIRAFLESESHTQITDDMFRAAERNVIADKDELLPLLQERKG